MGPGPTCDGVSYDVKNSPRNLARTLVVVLFLVPATGCDDLGPSGPKGPGSVRVDLLSPNGAEGSAVFEVRGGGTGLGVVTTAGGEVYYDHGTDATRVVVILDSPGQIGFLVRTRDLRNLPSVTVTQVADGNDQLRGSLSGYEVELTQLEDGGSG